MKFYLAGPDVFRLNAVSHGAELKKICFRAGHEGLYPFDNEIDLAAPDAALRIRLANEAMIRRCDAVVANISPFRGPNMDPGTAYEIGFARALGKPVFLYTDVADDRWLLVDRFEGDREFPACESFGLTENLMICAGEGVYDNVVQAINAAGYGVKK